MLPAVAQAFGPNGGHGDGVVDGGFAHRRSACDPARHWLASVLLTQRSSDAA
jgi:hypothetical protein